MKASSLQPARLWASALALVATPSVAAPAGPSRVAVFEQATFPFYNVSPLVSPRNIAASLRASGIAADVLDADALASSARFHASSYSALVLPYGNTFPQIAFNNMRAFHRAGGSLILSGVPFTHPVARLSAQGWSAHPSWGASARVATTARSGKAAIELTGPQSDWTGVFSERHPGQAGDRVTVADWTQSTGTASGNDWLYLRFYNAGGSYISQDGAQITPGAQWHQDRATITAPAGATAFDVAPQIRSGGRVVRLDDLSVAVGERAVALANAGFETPGADWSDLGHLDGASGFGPRGIGVGGFQDSPPGAVTIALTDPLGLKALGRA